MSTLEISPPVRERQSATDEELLRCYRRSRAPEDFAEIASRHRAMVFRTSLRLLGNAHDAEDATQTVFLALARRPDVIRRSLAGGLHQLARGVASEVFRSRRRRTHREEEARRRRPVADQASPLAPGPELREIREELDAALARLPDHLKQAVVLRYLEGHSPEEAARRAGCTPDALGWRANRGLDRLRAILQRRGVGGASGVLVATLAMEAAASPVRAAAFAATVPAATAKAAQALIVRSVVTTVGRQVALALTIAAPVALTTVPIIRQRAAVAPAAPLPVAAAPAPVSLGRFAQAIDIGSPARAGSTRFAEGRYTVEAGGGQIYRNRDQFRFVAQPWDGDGTTTVRVSFNPDQPGRQVAAGLMFREQLDAASLHVAMLVTSTESRATSRTAKTLPNSHVHIDDLPARGVQWVRLARRGDHFTLSVRPESLPDWTVVQELDVPLARSLYVGLAVTANDDSQLSIVEFDRLSLDAEVGPPSAPPGR